MSRLLAKKKKHRPPFALSFKVFNRVRSAASQDEEQVHLSLVAVTSSSPAATFVDTSCWL
ncbi:unnamed protein product [Brassica rapa]|uniref:Uncharacterized protein n=2 Tax=Brassica TaxID=3705 RepID=A0A8D9H975_BRACM|nr:unnamed protein product [Brassica napus]CAG7895215.1 unnamed protein product [Brassica rapa]